MLDLSNAPLRHLAAQLKLWGQLYQASLKEQKATKKDHVC